MITIILYQGKKLGMELSDGCIEPRATMFMVLDDVKNAAVNGMQQVNMRAPTVDSTSDIDREEASKRPAGESSAPARRTYSSSA